MANRALVGLGVVLEDVGGERRIGALDPSGILADLRSAGVPGRLCTWLSLQSLNRFDRVLLARDTDAGTYEGIVLIQCRSAGQTPFLVIEAMSGGSVSRQEALLKRMLAYLALRFDTFQEKPLAILARTRNPLLARVMSTLARGIGQAGFYPAANDAVVNLGVASLAYRMARVAGPDRRFAETTSALGGSNDAPDGPMLAAIDVRNLDDVSMVEGARRMFRARLPQSASKPPVRDVACFPAIRLVHANPPEPQIEVQPQRAFPVGPGIRW